LPKGRTKFFSKNKGILKVFVVKYKMGLRINKIDSLLEKLIPVAVFQINF